MDQLLEYEEIDSYLLGIPRKKEFMTKTACKVPCNYKVGVQWPPLIFHKM